MSKTKIVCTIGPASWDQEVMKQMIAQGMNCARVNGAFADPDELDKVRTLVRNASNEVSLMVDVKGPEVRLNKFLEPLLVNIGDTVIIGNTNKDSMFPSNYKDLYTFVKPGQRIVIGDGDTQLIVEKIIGDQMYCTVTYGEMIKPGKALNLPGCDYATDILTEKDRVNLRHSIETGWEFVSASFIQDAASAKYIREFIGNAPMKLIAKIENQAGLDNIDEILEVVDGIMVARGGLGVELGLEKVPAAQRMLIQKANAMGKIVITATQMLESMATAPRPTRAEVNDVATAVYQGTDSLMLSVESSAGKYPVSCVAMMRVIAEESENQIAPSILESEISYAPTADGLTKAAAQLCMSLKNHIDTVIVVSKTGTTPRLLTRHRITQPIHVFTSSGYSKNTLLLTKGITSAEVFEGIKRSNGGFDRDQALTMILQKALASKAISKGQRILFIGKTPVQSDEYFPNIFEIVEV